MQKQACFNIFNNLLMLRNTREDVELRRYSVIQRRPKGQCRFGDLRVCICVKGSQLLLSLLLLFFVSPAVVLGGEDTPLKPGIPKNYNYPAEPEGFLSRLDNYIWKREKWGLIDEVRAIVEQTAEVHAHRLGNRFVLRTPFGGFLWEYEKTWGDGSIFPRRNNVFGGRLHKQSFKTGTQDIRKYGYAIDTKRLRRWLKNGAEEPPLKPLDIRRLDVKGYFIFTDSDADTGNGIELSSARERSEAIETEFNAHVNRGRWYGLGFDFMYIRYNPTFFAKFSVVDQREAIDRDLWRGRITYPFLEKFHISGLYEENNDVHRITNTNIPSVGGIPALLIPNRSMHPTQRKYGPEVKYFFGKDLHKAVSMGFYRYAGESAGRLAEFGLKRAFRIDSVGQFSSLDLHNSFGLALGYEEYEERDREEEEKRGKWGLQFEAGYLDSDDVSGPFTGTIFLLTRPSGPPFRRPTTTVRQFDEDLKQLFFKGKFTYHFNPKGERPHPLAGELGVDFSFWNIEREGKQTQRYPLIGEAENIRSFRDDRRILQFAISYELDKPRHRFWGVYSLGLDFNWDIENSDKVGGINVGFFY